MSHRGHFSRAQLLNKMMKGVSMDSTVIYHTKDGICHLTFFWGTDEAREGMQAFKEKRPPEFIV